MSKDQSTSMGVGLNSLGTGANLELNPNLEAPSKEFNWEINGEIRDRSYSIGSEFRGNTADSGESNREPTLSTITADSGVNPDLGGRSGYQVLGAANPRNQGVSVSREDVNREIRDRSASREFNCKIGANSKPEANSNLLASRGRQEQDWNILGKPPEEENQKCREEFVKWREVSEATNPEIDEDIEEIQRHHTCLKGESGVLVHSIIRSGTLNTIKIKGGVFDSGGDGACIEMVEEASAKTKLLKDFGKNLTPHFAKASTIHEVVALTICIHLLYAQWIVLLALAVCENGLILAAFGISHTHDNLVPSLHFNLDAGENLKFADDLVFEVKCVMRNPRGYFHIVGMQFKSHMYHFTVIDYILAYMMLALGSIGMKSKLERINGLFTHIICLEFRLKAQSACIGMISIGCFSTEVEFIGVNILLWTITLLFALVTFSMVERSFSGFDFYTGGEYSMFPNRAYHAKLFIEFFIEEFQLVVMFLLKFDESTETSNLLLCSLDDAKLLIKVNDSEVILTFNPGRNRVISTHHELVVTDMV